MIVAKHITVPVYKYTSKTLTLWHHNLRDSFRGCVIGYLPWPPDDWHPCSKTRSWCHCCSLHYRMSPSSSCLPVPWSQFLSPMLGDQGQAVTIDALKKKDVIWILNWCFYLSSNYLKIIWQILMIYSLCTFLLWINWLILMREMTLDISLLCNFNQPTIWTFWTPSWAGMNMSLSITATMSGSVTFMTASLILSVGHLTDNLVTFCNKQQFLPQFGWIQPSTVNNWVPMNELNWNLAFVNLKVHSTTFYLKGQLAEQNLVLDGR